MSNLIHARPECLKTNNLPPIINTPININRFYSEEQEIEEFVKTMDKEVKYFLPVTDLKFNDCSAIVVLDSYSQLK